MSEKHFEWLEERVACVLDAWETPEFESTLKAEIEKLGLDELPLQQGLSVSSYALDNDVKAVVLSISEASGTIQAKVGVFYTGIIPGCSCADDPTPVDEMTEYCELQFKINRQTAQATVELL